MISYLSRLHRWIQFLFAFALILVLSAHPGHGGEDLDLSNTLAQDEFENAVRDLGVAFSYRPIETPEAKGITGFQAGVAVTGIDLNDDKQYMKQSFSDSNPPSFAAIPKVYLSKGLPMNFDVEGFVGGRPGGNERLFGAAVKWSYWEGNTVSPAIGIRAHGTRLEGVDSLDLSTYGADLSISKGFAMVTPFAGYSLFGISGEETQSNLTLDDVSTTEDRIFVGTRLSLGIFNGVAEVDFGEVNSYSLRLNLGF